MIYTYHTFNIFLIFSSLLIYYILYISQIFTHQFSIIDYYYLLQIPSLVFPQPHPPLTCYKFSIPNKSPKHFTNLLFEITYNHFQRGLTPYPNSFIPTSMYFTTTSASRATSVYCNLFIAAVKAARPFFFFGGVLMASGYVINPRFPIQFGCVTVLGRI